MNQSLKMAGVAVLGAGVGFAIGYKVAEKQLGERFETRLEEETADMREFYTSHKKTYDTPEEAAAALIPQPEEAPEDPREKTQKVQYHKIVANKGYDGVNVFKEGCEVEEPEVHRNVFDEQPHDGPVIITQEDFMANETGYEQATLTYYVKGDTLTDQRDEIFENAIDVVGPLAVHNFGEGSSDPNTVHVRNSRLQMEFEIVKSDRSYEEDVLGQVVSPG